MSVIVPVKGLGNIKSRLSSLLSLNQRQELTFHMLEDVLSAIGASSLIDECTVVSPSPQILKFAGSAGAQTLKEAYGRGVNIAVSKGNAYSVKRGATCTIIFPGDIPLLLPQDVDEIVRAGRGANSVVITPSVRLDGTNALLRNPPEVVPTYYDRESFRSHLAEAKRRRLCVKLLLSRRVMLDIDTPEDIKQFLSINSNTLTYEFLHRVLREEHISV